MTTIVTRAGKGSPLTHTEVDTNFTNLNTAKLEAGAIALGSAATPSISFTGDTNTGIYSPGADQVAISTNGSEKLIVKSDGKVGIGTSTVDGNIHIADGTRANLILKKTGLNDVTNSSLSTTYDVMQLGAGGSFASYNVETATADTQIGHNFYRHSGGTYRYKYTDTAARVSFNSPGGAIIFERAASGTANTDITFSESMRLDSSGRLGIGTTSPVALLQPNGTVSITDGSSASSANGLHLYFSTATNTGYISAFHSGVDNRDLLIDGKTIGFTIAGSEAARIDSSKRLLVGTSTTGSALPGQADQKFQVAGGTDGGITMSSFSADPYASNLEFRKSRSASIGTKTIVQSGDTLGKFYYCGADGTNFIPAAAIEAFVDGTPGANDMPGRLVFSTTADGASTPTERMRITQAGHVFVGSVTGDYNTVGGSLYSDGYIQAVTNGRSAMALNRKGSNGVILDFYRDTNNPGSISVTTTATSYNTSSDYRLKENVTQVTDGITRLQQLKPSRFNFIAAPGCTVDGFIAHEVQSVVPEAITGEKDAVDEDGNPIYQGIDQSKLVPLLTAALQEAITKIETLEAKVAALETK